MPVRLPSINDLDNSQKSVVQHLPYDDPMFVKGPPGSGKTHVAILRLNMLLDNGYTNVLFLLYNHSMYGFLNTIFKKMGLKNSITIDTKDIYFKKIAEANGYSGWSYGGDYKANYNSVLNYLSNKSGLPRYDVIVVDECQDFSNIEMKILEKLSPKIIAVGDFEQSIYTSDGKIFLSKMSTKQLSTIYRYGKNVASIAEHFSKDRSNLKSKVTNDDKTDVYKVKATGQSDAIDKIVRLVQAKRNTDLTVAILSITNKQLQGLQSQLKSKGVDSFYCMNNKDFRDYNYDSSAPILLTPFSAKGMEFDCVILYGYDGILNWSGFNDNQDEIIYVSLTRTCKELYLIEESNTYSSLKNLSEWVELNPSSGTARRVDLF